jgi:hypothetical protein
MAENQQTFRLEDQERVPNGARFQPLEAGKLGHRRQRVAGDERAASDSLPEPVGRLLPVRLTVRRVGPQVGDVAMLSERLASAHQVAAFLQARVEVVQQRAADLAHFLRSQRGLDSAADVTEVGLLRGDVPPCDRQVLVEQLGNGDVRIMLPSGTRELEQLDELDLRHDLGPAGLPEPDLAPGQRVFPCVHPGTPRPARRLLDVTAGLTRQATQLQSPRSTNESRIDRRGHKTRRWGGRGSNPRPADYEKHAQLQHAPGQQRCHAFVAMKAHMALDFTGRRSTPNPLVALPP